MYQVGTYVRSVWVAREKKISFLASQNLPFRASSVEVGFQIPLESKFAKSWSKFSKLELKFEDRMQVSTLFSQ